MKKSLVALAALAATSAFAQFSIDGLMDVGYGTVNYKDTTASGVINNGANTSQINFRGPENLGGGLTATFRVETDWNTVSNKGNTGFVNATNTTASTTAIAAPVTLANANSGGGTFGNGEIRVGLEGNFGQLHLGAPNNETLTANLTGQPFGTAIGSGFRGVSRSDAGTMGASAVRFDNSFKYITPSVSGFKGSLVFVQKNSSPFSGTAATSSTISQAYDFTTTFGAYDYAGVQELGLHYNVGPLNAVFTNQVTDAINIAGLTGAAGETKRTLNTLGVNYTMGAFTGYLLNQSYSAKNSSNVIASDTDYTAVSVKYVAGPHSVMASSGVYKLNDAASSSAAYIGKKSSMTSLGYTYELSKMSNIYARYETINDEANAITKVATMDVTTTGKRSRTAIGVKVGF